jgi:flagellar hook-basal body complex protein FliE
MVDRISSLAREALSAAQKVARQAHGALERAMPAGSPGPTASPVSTRVDAPDFAQVLEAGVERVNHSVQASENLPTDLLSGKVGDFHEIAVQLKDAELSFKFAMEIRNKLIDAYREIMRMSV